MYTYINVQKSPQKEAPCSFLVTLLTPHLLSLANTNLLSVAMDMLFVDILQKWNYIIPGLAMASII